MSASPYKDRQALNMKLTELCGLVSRFHEMSKLISTKCEGTLNYLNRRHTGSFSDAVELTMYTNLDDLFTIFDKCIQTDRKEFHAALLEALDLANAVAEEESLKESPRHYVADSFDLSEDSLKDTLIAADNFDKANRVRQNILQGSLSEAAQTIHNKGSIILADDPAEIEVSRQPSPISEIPNDDEEVITKKPDPYWFKLVPHVRKAFVESGLSKIDFAVSMDISYNTLRKFEKREKVSLENVEKIIKFSRHLLEEKEIELEWYDDSE